jgi:hypothetical protein
VSSGSAAIIVLMMTSSIALQTSSHLACPSRLASHCLKAVRDHLKPSISGLEEEGVWPLAVGEEGGECVEDRTSEGRRDERAVIIGEGERERQRTA